MIKWFLASQYLLVACISFYQENIYSLYFKTPQPFSKEKHTFPDDIQGCYYKDNDSLIQLCISKDSIYSCFTLIFPITKKEITEFKYEKIDTLLFGLKEGEGVPFIES